MGVVEKAQEVIKEVNDLKTKVEVINSQRDAAEKKVAQYLKQLEDMGVKSDGLDKEIATLDKKIKEVADSIGLKVEKAKRKRRGLGQVLKEGLNIEAKSVKKEETVKDLKSVPIDEIDIEIEEG